MNKTEALDKLQQLLRDWGTFIEDKVVDTAPGQVVDIDSVALTKLDYLNDLRPYRQYLDGYALSAFDKMIDVAAGMSNQDNVLSAYNAIQTAHEEVMKVFPKPERITVIKLADVSGSRTKDHDPKQELKTLEAQRYIRYKNEADADKAARRIRKLLKPYDVAIEKVGNTVKITDGQAIKLG